MEYEIIIPPISNDTDSCQLIEWHIELESQVSGVLTKLIVPSGGWVEVSKSVGMITVSDEE